MKVAIGNRDACGLGSIVLRVIVDNPKQDVFVGAGDTKIIDIVEGASFTTEAYRSKIIEGFDPVTGARKEAVNNPLEKAEPAKVVEPGANKPVNVVPADISAQATPITGHEGGVDAAALVAPAEDNPENAKKDETAEEKTAREQNARAQKELAERNAQAARDRDARNAARASQQANKVDFGTTK